MEPRAAMFQKMLSGRIVDLRLFAKMCYAGIPAEYRLTSYQILLGVIGLDTARFALERRERRRRYQLYQRARHGADETASAHGQEDSGQGAPVSRPAIIYRVNRTIEHQIQIDVARISPIYKKYNGADYSELYIDVLATIANQRPYLGYVQGMADLVAPFLHLYYITNGSEIADAVAAQAAVFACLSALLGQLQAGLFDLQAGLLGRLERLLEVVDGELIAHLRSIGLDLHVICFRWFSCVFIRELSLPAWYRLFDSLLCDALQESMLYFAAALLMWYRGRIIGQEISAVVLLMQNLQQEGLSVESIETMIGSASFIRREYADKHDVNT
ncbi:TBC1 domain family member 2 [Pancytospora philotis]|nr:TBC1 domain family member 2 [Pancytospora philotis]